MRRRAPPGQHVQLAAHGPQAGARGLRLARVVGQRHPVHRAQRGQALQVAPGAQPVALVRRIGRAVREEEDIEPACLRPAQVRAILTSRSVRRSASGSTSGLER